MLTTNQVFVVVRHMCALSHTRTHTNPAQKSKCAPLVVHSGPEATADPVLGITPLHFIQHGALEKRKQTLEIVLKLPLP